LLILKNFTIAILLLFCLNGVILAQHTALSYYDSKKIYSKEVWNKANTEAHFFMYFEDGKLKAEGYMKRDRYRHYKIPWRSFVAYNAGGKLIQQMSMNADSAIVYTYDDAGTLRNKIIVYPHHCTEFAYFSNGKIQYINQLNLTPKLSYYTDYYYPDKWVKANYQVHMYARPLWPLGYGTAGNDGVSASGTYKIYFHADVQEPHCVSTGTGTLYDSTGTITNLNHFPRY